MLLSDSTQQVSLPAARIAEREEVLVPVDERALEQCVELYVDLPRQSLAIKGLPSSSPAAASIPVDIGPPDSGVLLPREVKILMRLPDGRNVATRQAVHGSAP